MIVDLADLEWWQTLVGIIAILGLSPGPWLLGMAFGRIQFSRPAANDYNQRVADLKEQHAMSTAAVIKAHEVVIAALIKSHNDTLASRDERIVDLKQALSKVDDARNVERERAHAATEMLGRSVEAVEVSNHFFESLGKAAKEGTS